MKVNVPKYNDQQLKFIVILIGITFTLFVIVKALQKIGLINSLKKRKEENEKAIAAFDMRTSQYFNTNWLEQNPNYQRVGKQAEILADELYSSMYSFLGLSKYPNVEKILSIFGSLPNRQMIGEITAYYYVNEGRFLGADLMNRLNDDGIAQLNKIINKLPQ